MGRDKMKQLREIVCQESESLDDAFTYEKCKELYLRLITDGVKESIAKQETLKLFNEAQWLACQEILQVTTWVTHEFDDVDVSDYFSKEDVRALVKKMPRRVPTKRNWFAHDSTKESFPVKYKSYDKWGEKCLYSLYDVTKGHTDDLLVELLYDSTDTEDGKMKLLNDIIEDAHRMWEDPEQKPGYIWALTKREELQHQGKSNEDKLLYASTDTEEGRKKLLDDITKECVDKNLQHQGKSNEDKVKIDRDYFVNTYGNDKIEQYEGNLEKLKEKKCIVKQGDKYKLSEEKVFGRSLKMKQKYLSIWHKKICQRLKISFKSGADWSILVHYVYDKNGKPFDQDKIRKIPSGKYNEYILDLLKKEGLFPEETDLNQ